jgi:hypothetical protein
MRQEKRKMRHESSCKKSERGYFAHVILRLGLADELSAIRLIDRRVQVER